LLTVGHWRSTPAEFRIEDSFGKSGRATVEDRHSNPLAHPGFENIRDATPVALEARVAPQTADAVIA
jgi:hypothetical protein